MSSLRSELTSRPLSVVFSASSFACSSFDAHLRPVGESCPMHYYTIAQPLEYVRWSHLLRLRLSSEIFVSLRKLCSA